MMGNPIISQYLRTSWTALRPQRKDSTAISSARKNKQRLVHAHTHTHTHTHTNTRTHTHTHTHRYIRIHLNTHRYMITHARVMSCPPQHCPPGGLRLTEPRTHFLPDCPCRVKSLKYTPGGTEAGLAYTASVGPEMEDLAC